MPISPETRVDRGDVLRIIGPLPEVDRASKALGYADRKTSATDMVFVGTGIFLGGLVGLLSVVVWNVPLTLTASGGALVMGLVFGWLRSVYPYFGRIPEPAIWIFDTLGLCMFIGIVGLTAGPSFVSGLQKTGVTLVVVGLISALLPHTIGILLGRYVLKMNPLIVLGACAGAGTITAALRAVQDEAKSSVPALGYTVPYAIGNILLTAWGPVLVMMMSICNGLCHGAAGSSSPRLLAAGTRFRRCRDPLRASRWGCWLRSVSLGGRGGHGCNPPQEAVAVARSARRHAVARNPTSSPSGDRGDDLLAGFGQHRSRSPMAGLRGQQADPPRPSRPLGQLAAAPHHHRRGAVAATDPLRAPRGGPVRGSRP